MFKTFRNALKVKEIRKRLLFTFLMMIVIRLGCQLPVPGVDREYFSNWFAQQTGDSFNFIDAENFRKNVQNAIKLEKKL